MSFGLSGHFILTVANLQYVRETGCSFALLAEGRNYHPNFRENMKMSGKKVDVFVIVLNNVFLCLLQQYTRRRKGKRRKDWLMSLNKDGLSKKAQMSPEERGRPTVSIIIDSSYVKMGRFS